MPSGEKTGRREEAEKNFKSAAEALQRDLSEKTRRRLGQIKFPDFSNVASAEENAKSLEDALENLIEVKKKKKDIEKKKMGDVLIGWFRASYPFARLFLNVAKEGAAVVTFLSDCVNSYRFHF